MDESELINEVLELTLACQNGDATQEECARLERLLADHPNAISWYLRVVDDTLTLRDVASATDGASTSAHESLIRTLASAEPRRSDRSGFLAFTKLRPRFLWPAAAIACGLLVAAAIAVFSPTTPVVTEQQVANAWTARIVNVSNVEWGAGADQFDEWSVLQPGTELKFKSGWINLFISNGAELLIEGPANVLYVSPEKVIARQGKLAARVGPGAVGFRIETPHANVIDRGTEFGLSVDGESHTSVVVYKGIVDMDPVGNAAGTRRRMETGEALRVDGAGKLSRITTVASDEFLEPPQLRLHATMQRGLITSISDNIRSLKTTKYYRVIPNGFGEDCQAYVDRLHEWNGVDSRGLPPFLIGGDYVMTFNDDKIAKDLSIAVTLSQPSNVYLLIDDRVPPADWLKRDFVDTGWDVGADEGYVDRDIHTVKGTGQSIDHVYSVWRRRVSRADTIVLGALGAEQFTKPARDVERSMYGIVVTPLRGERLN